MVDPSISPDIVNSIFKQSEKFAIIGLTGRVRAGQDDVVKILTTPHFNHLRSTSALGGKHNNDTERENNIILRFMLHHWRPFIRIHVSVVMMSFLLEVYTNTTAETYDDNIIFAQACKDVFTDKKSNSKSEHVSLANAMRIFCTNLYCMLIKKEARTEESEGKFFNTLNDAINELISELTADDTIAENMLAFWQRRINKNTPALNALDDSKLLLFCFIVLPLVLQNFKTILGDNKYIVEMQKIGNNLRAYGKPFPINPDNISDGLKGENIFCIAERINMLVKILRNTKICSNNAEMQKNNVLILIDDFKNVYEVYYFRKRYSSFYLLSVSTDEEARRKNFNYKEELFQTSGLNEAPNVGRKKHKSFVEVYRKFINEEFANVVEKAEIVLSDTEKHELQQKCADAGLTDYEFIFCIQAFNDRLRRYCYLNNLHSFILQDIVPCVENADIFITNNYHKEYGPSQYPKDVGGYHLRHDILRYITLMLHPALLTPTSIERCMQLAMAAKLNSGCLARQVGAVVTDRDFNILSLGWNDSPCGTVSCIRRNFYDLKQKFDPDAYSEYELNNKEFRSYIDNWNAVDKELLNGLPGAFCFKDVYGRVSGGREQIHTRALHGEERALSVCGAQAKGGYLFTTSSPCELCAKRAKDAGIEKIYFIEQFSGISESHVIQAGQPRAEYEFFTGATGTAYTKLYTPIIPYKDELSARGFNPSEHNATSKLGGAE